MARLKKWIKAIAPVELMLEDGSKYDLPGVLRLSEVTVDQLRAHSFAGAIPQSG